MLNFTEVEYEREIGLHGLKKEEGQTASSVWMMNRKTIEEFPKSGVFRDFKQYGVYPARVRVLNFDLTVPFIIKFMSTRQVQEEILNQSGKKYDKAVKKLKEMSLAGQIMEKPNVHECYELVQSFKSETHRFRGYTPALHNYMVMANSLFFFSIPLKRKAVKVQPETVRDVARKIPLKIVREELEARVHRDPGMWGNVKVESPSVRDSEELLEELMIYDPYTPKMREIVRNLKKVSFRHEMYKIIERLVLKGWKKYMIPSVTVVISNRQRGLRIS